jgi:hypothetical protein
MKYNTLRVRIRRGTVKAKKIGWIWVIHRDDVAKLKPAQARRSSK